MKDLARITAEKIIYTLETPREVRMDERRKRRAQREHWTTRYFGMVLPLSVQVWRSKRRSHQQDNDTPGV